MKIAICDDDWNMQNTLRIFIEETCQDNDMLVEGFTSGESLLAAINKQSRPYEMIFLNIEMFGSDGVETARQVRTLLPDCYLVVSAIHRQIPLAEGTVLPFRYLLQPIRPQTFYETILAVKKEIADTKTITVCETTLHANDVIYIKAQDQGVRIVTSQKIYHDSKRFKDVIAHLESDGFCRIHRDALINVRYIASLEGNMVHMVNGECLPLGLFRKSALKQAVQKYIQ